MNLELNEKEATILREFLGNLKTTDVETLASKNSFSDDAETIDETIYDIYVKLKNQEREAEKEFSKVLYINEVQYVDNGQER